MAGVGGILSFIGASALVIVIPGPATLFVGGAASRSAWSAVRAVAGVVLGDLVLITLAGLGFASLVARFPAVSSLMRVLGAAYIFYLGVNLIRRPGAAPSAETSKAGSRRGARRRLISGLLITISNPKPILFFAAFFPLFISGGSASRLQDFYGLGAVFEAVNIAYFAVLISAVRQLGKIPKMLPAGRLERVGGGGLIVCAAAVLLTALPGPL